jgi:serine/threonine protein phosphatase PrpC
MHFQKLKYILFLGFYLFLPSQCLTFKTGIAWDKGVRYAYKKEPMEDRHYLSSNVLGTGIFFAGVYDGHGGAQAAEFLKNNLHIHICRALLKNSYPLSPILKEVFERVDTTYLKCQEGSTALVLLVDKGSISLVHVGDSRALLLNKKGTILFSTKDHKPNDFKEKLRIQHAGGFIRGNRAQGILAMSRAFGDAPLKPIVSAEPDIFSCKMMPDIEYAVLATDGIWDTLSNEEVAQIALQEIMSSGSAELTAQKILQESQKRLLDDNVTVIVIQFIH